MKDRIQEIFAGALARKSLAERQQHLDAACGDDRALRQEVESLLAVHYQAGGFLHQPVAASAAQKTLPIPSLAEFTGTRIGRYKLLERIGEGGFGVVWMAEQEEPVHRRVALKIIKLGMDTKEVVARFEAERQALALMDHPNIATVYDGGATDKGRPYFVMELVKGVPITDYCDANKLPTTERLKLFMQVCQAVQHAHQKGVIHRDLKPSNILVTVKDDQPVPKVIDFGVAKATQARLTERTMFTQFRQLIGTPAYMSPEQAGLGSLDVDTRSDIYSLGVLLYELLTGRTPFDTQKLLEKGYDAVMRAICEEEPPKPSTRLSTLSREELTAVAAKRNAEPGKLNRLVHGDLDWIVMKALEKDRRRRYETPNAVARDVEHFLNAEPVSAAAPTIAYRVGKFARRNRAALATTAVIAVTLVAGTALSVWQAVRATHFARELSTQQKIAVKEAERATRLAEASLVARRQAERDAYVGRILLVSQHLRNGDISNGERALDECPPSLRRWEWNFLKRSLYRELMVLPAARQLTEDSPRFDLMWSSRLIFTRNANRLWVSSDLSQGRSDGAFYSLANGARLAGGSNWSRSIPCMNGKHVICAATPQSPSAYISIASGRVLTSFAGAPGTPVALSPDENLVACWAMPPDPLGKAGTNRLLIASATTGRSICEIGFADGGGSLLWGPDQRWIVACGKASGGVVEVPSGSVAFPIKPVAEIVPDGLAFSSTGDRLARVNGNVMLSDPLSVWDLPTRRRLFQISLPRGAIPAHVFFADHDKTLVVAFTGFAVDPKGAGGPDDLWFIDAVTGDPKRRVRLDSRLKTAFWGISSLAVSPDGMKLAAGTMDGNLYLLNVAGTSQQRVAQAKKNLFCRLAFDADGSRLAAMDSQGKVSLWDISEADKIGAGTLSSDGCLILHPRGGQVRYDDLERRETFTLTSPAVFSPDGKWLCRADGVWNVRKEVLAHPLSTGPRYERVLSFSTDGRRAVIGSCTNKPDDDEDGIWGPMLVQVVDTDTWRPVGGPIKTDSHAHFTLNFDGRLAAVAIPRQRVAVYEFSTNLAVPLQRCTFSGTPPFCFSRDGQWLLSGRRRGGFQQVETQSGSIIKSCTDIKGDIGRFELSRTGRYVCLHLDPLEGGSDEPTYECPWPVQVWDLQTTQLIVRLQQWPSLFCTVFHPNGYLMALTGQDSVLRIWDVEKRAVLVTLPVKARDWRWSSDGTKLTAVTLDGRVLRFDGSPWRAGEVKTVRTPFRERTFSWLERP